MVDLVPRVRFWCQGMSAFQNKTGDPHHLWPETHPNHERERERETQADGLGGLDGRREHLGVVSLMPRTVRGTR